MNETAYEVIVAWYAWPMEMEDCSRKATIANVCKYAGKSFEILYFILKHLGMNFTLYPVEADFINDAFDYDLLMAQNKIHIATDNDKMIPNYIDFNISYLPQPYAIGYPVLIYNPHLYTWQGSIVGAFQRSTWLTLIVVYVFVLILVTSYILHKSPFSNIHRLSFDQRNYKVWHNWFRKLFIVFWAINTATIFKFYKSKLLSNLVPVHKPIIPYRGIIPLITNPNDLQEYDYRFIVGDLEYESDFFALGDITLAKRFEQFTKTAHGVHNVKSSMEFIDANEGTIGVTYNRRASDMRAKNDAICFYDIRDVPYEAFAIPFNNQFKWKKQIMHAGYAIEEAGILSAINRKYHVGVDVREGCSSSYNARRVNRLAGFHIHAIVPVLRTTAIGYMVAILVFVGEYLHSRLRKNWKP